MKVECEQCGKNVFGKKAFEVLTGKVEFGNDYVGFPNGSESITGIKNDGLFCSLTCLALWIQNRARKKK